MPRKQDAAGIPGSASARRYTGFNDRYKRDPRVVVSDDPLVEPPLPLAEGEAGAPPTTSGGAAGEPRLVAEPFTLLEGDVIDMLRGLPEGRVSCVMTSPPYYGLRDYGIPPRVWDGQVDCDHQWGSRLPDKHPGQVEQTKWKSAVAAGAVQTMGSGQYCRVCSAWLGVLGQEPTLDLFIAHLVDVFREVRRVLHPSGSLWLNLGDCYAGGGRHDERKEIYDIPAGAKPRRPKQRRLSGKDLLMVPARVALALQADGWILRNDIIWAKALSFLPSFSGSVMPESTRDRATWAHEHLFHLVKQESYYYDQDGCREAFADSTKAQLRSEYRGQGRKDYAAAGAQNPSDTKRRILEGLEARGGRNLRNVWVIPKQNFPGSHFATFSEKLVEPVVRLGSSPKGVCRECASPMVRSTQREPIPESVTEAFEASRAATAAATGRTDGHTARRPTYRRKVLGESWEPSCACGAGVVPATVLDIFSGSGRTGVVALREGRRYIGIDINPAYHAIARAALTGHAAGAGTDDV